MGIPNKRIVYSVRRKEMALQLVKLAYPCPRAN